MSAAALTWCWKQRPRTPSQKLVLAALADRADDDGECFPSIGWLSVKCAPMPPESVRRVLRELAAQGLVAKTDRRRRSDGTLGTWLYRLPLDQCAPVHAGPEEASDDAADDTTSVHERTVGQRAPVNKPACTSARAEPSIEPSMSSTDVEDAADPSKTSKPDPVWDSLVEWLGYEPKTRTERKGWNRVVRELREAGATGESVKAAAKAYDSEWKGLERSPYALMKWWSRFLVQNGGKNVRSAVLSWARNVGTHLEGHGLDDELLAWARRGADDDTLDEARRIATTPIERLAAGA